MINKFDKSYKTIGEVVKILDLKNRSGQKTATHTIRFWEKEFKQIKPKVFNGNRRYYDKSNIDLLKKIKFLLKDQGMTNHLNIELVTVRGKGFKLWTGNKKAFDN